MADNSGNDAIIAAGIQTVGNAAVAAASNRRQYKNQIKAMSEQTAQNKALWDYQNAYNTPAMQMQRYRDAGLNPNLIYGSGAAASGNAGPIQPTEVPTKQAIRPELPDAMSRYLNARQADAQYAATRQNVELAQTRGELMNMQIALTNFKTMEQMARSKNFSALADVELNTKKFIELKSAELFANEKSKGHLLDQLGQKRTMEMHGLKLDNEFKQNRNDLAKVGIYSTDHPAFRLLIAASQRMGLDLGKLLSDYAPYVKSLIKGN